MSDAIKHECGIALIRLRKPLDYYIEKYGTSTYGIDKLHIMLNKQRNRGQDGAGVASIKLGIEPGHHAIDMVRSADPNPIENIFGEIGELMDEAHATLSPEHTSKQLKHAVPYIGDIFLGHLRYGTHGVNTIQTCHPVIRPNNWRSRALVMAGNFNMTNVDELFDNLVSIGQFPKDRIDTVTVLEKVGHFLDEENHRVYTTAKVKTEDNIKISQEIEEQIDMSDVLSRSCKDFDGGYAMIGGLGSGHAFVVRDPAGIRPAYFYADDEVIVVASEKPAIKTAFDVNFDQIQEVKPGHGLFIQPDGSFEDKEVLSAVERKACSFERIYFSRGNDPDIYKERKKLGELLTRPVIDALDGDVRDAIFAFVPNTADTAFLGLVHGVDAYLNEQKADRLKENNLTSEQVQEILSFRPRVERLIHKDKRMRTFISADDGRDDLVAHIYDTTYGVVRPGVDTIVAVDDSIVRGTTMQKSILHNLCKLQPKAIIAVSSAPQIRYPDCYGIDMSNLENFVAFRALLVLLEKNNLTEKLDDVYSKCKASLEKPVEEIVNHVKELYDLFDYETLSEAIAEVMRPEGCEVPIKVIYQNIEGLHEACPNNLGDWYFTGNYPTPGGNRVVNKAFVNFVEGSKGRAY